MKQYRGGGSHWQTLHRSALEANAERVQPQRNTTAVWNQDTSSKLSDKPEHLNTVQWTANATDA